MSIDHFSSASEMLAALASKEISSVEEEADYKRMALQKAARVHRREQPPRLLRWHSFSQDLKGSPFAFLSY